MHTLLWFQHDLRIHDNPSLTWALQQGKPIIAVYIHSPEEDAPWAAGAASRWWLHQSLKKLSADLLQLGIRLQFFKASSVETIPRLITAAQIDAVVWTNRHEPQRLAYEAKLETLLQDKGIVVQRFRDGLLSRPDQFLTAGKNTPYRVFTPFYKKLRSELALSNVYPSNRPGVDMPGLGGHSPTDSSGPKQLKLGQLELEQLDLVDDHIWYQKLEKHWSPGEATAADRLDRFIDEALTNYHTDRNIPALDGTSGLSPHLHFGEISPQQIVSALAPLIECQGGSIGSAAEGFLRQLIWREFARYILWHFPETSTESMNRKFTKSFWSHHTVNLKKWQQGKTGIPIIDAGMKQLWATGTMHNRVRMLVASLLTKNMGIAWQEGARWFWDTLVDADLANNSMGWQWVAGCGVDAAPYFRIFNPDTQAQRFDEQGVYVDRWLKITSSTSQTRPVVDLAISRSRALDRYNSMISKPYTSQQDQAQEKA